MARKTEVIIGSVWEVRWHDGSLTHVRITGEHRYPIRSGYWPYEVTGSKIRYSAVNLETGRRVEIKSAAKLRRRISPVTGAEAAAAMRARRV